MTSIVHSVNTMWLLVIIKPTFLS